MSERRFWEDVSLDRLTSEEWELLCDGCGKCCLHKLRDDDSEEVFYTDVACQYLDRESCECTTYENRLEKVPGCINLNKNDLSALEWLPESCAYKLRYHDQPLPSWHHLNSGTIETIHKQGLSVANKVFSETEVEEEDLEERVVYWVE